MSDSGMCVLLACAGGDHWALPQHCLAEILTLAVEEELPPGQVTWRGCSIPVIVVGEPGAGDNHWRDRHSGTGLVAVIPGLPEGACEYWAVAILGQGLRLCAIDGEAIEEAPQQARDYASAAFEMAGVTYQVPDLRRMQAELSTGQLA